MRTLKLVNLEIIIKDNFYLELRLFYDLFLKN